MDKKYTACVAASLAMTVTLIACTPPSTANSSDKPSRVWDFDNGNDVFRFEDTEKGVTCWVFDGYKAGGIHCERSAHLLPEQE